LTDKELADSIKEERNPPEKEGGWPWKEIRQELYEISRVRPKAERYIRSLTPEMRQRIDEAFQKIRRG
jgi:hypothetical protein